jgi:hypothetical protein
MHQALRSLDAAILGVHRAASDRDAASKECLCGGVGACGDDDTRAFVAHWERLADPTCQCSHCTFAQRDADDRPLGGTAEARGVGLGACEQEPEVRWIDRRGLHANDDLGGCGLGDRRLDERDLECSLRCHERAQLEA